MFLRSPSLISTRHPLRYIPVKDGEFYCEDPEFGGETHLDYVSSVPSEKHRIKFETNYGTLDLSFLCLCEELASIPSRRRDPSKSCLSWPNRVSRWKRSQDGVSEFSIEGNSTFGRLPHLKGLLTCTLSIIPFENRNWIINYHI